MSLKSQMIRLLPDAVLRGIKRCYYPRVVRRYAEADWPFAAMVKALVPEGGCVLDIGANIGYLSKLFSGWVGPSGSVHSFEPVPETFQLLEHNVRRVGLHNVHVHNLALSSTRGSCTMEIPTYPDGRPNLYESYISPGGGEGVAIEMDTLDQRGLGDVDFIKIDVEGHEWEVLQGGRALVARCLPPLLIEVEGNLEGRETPTGKLNAFLADLGYRPFILRAGGLQAWEYPHRAVDYLYLTEAQQARLDPLVE
jgi:FkbM family methyltransferase